MFGFCPFCKMTNVLLPSLVEKIVFVLPNVKQSFFSKKAVFCSGCLEKTVPVFSRMQEKYYSDNYQRTASLAFTSPFKY